MRNKIKKSFVHRLVLRPVCVLLSLVLMVSAVLPAWAATLSADIAVRPLAGEVTADVSGVPYGEAFGKVADPYLGYAAFSASTLDNGRLWTDKSVSTSQAVIYDSAGKAVGSVPAKADEFMVALSAMTQSFSVQEVVATPSDTVFVIDLSLSMVNNKINGVSRLDLMFKALNEAIAILMEGHPENRIAVAAFGGDSGKSRIVNVFQLDRYDEVTSGEYFHKLSASYYVVDDAIDRNKLMFAPTEGLYRIKAVGGTSTQQGIYAGAQLLLNEQDTTFDSAAGELPRKPNIVLLTDGDPTIGWTDYKFENFASTTADGFDCGDANNSDMGLDILTVLTAAHFKEVVHDHYYRDEDTAQTVGFYNIGLGVIDSPNSNAVLDPLGTTGGRINAELINKSTSGAVYNMKAALDSFINSGSATFPALEKGSGSKTRLVTINNTDSLTGGRDLTGYDYSDRYETAETAVELSDAFKSIAQQIVSTANYSTETNGQTPNYAGLVTFSDVLGEYMEFESAKGIWFNNHRYDGGQFAKKMKEDTAGRFTDATANVMMNHEAYVGINSLAQAQSILSSSTKAGKAGGGIYYNNSADFSNRIRYYADSDLNWQGNYFTDAGVPQDPPGTAACIVDLYLVTGTVHDPVSNEETDMLYTTFQVITALKPGKFQEVGSDGQQLVRYLEEGQQMVRWYIPASLLPVRTVTGGANKNVHIIDTVPIRAIYAVGLNEERVQAGLSAAYQTANQKSGNAEEYYFYTNEWNRSTPTADGRDNQSMAYFIPGKENPYYYYTNADAAQAGDPNPALVGKIPLYEKVGNQFVRTADVSVANGKTYYTQTRYYDAATGGVAQVEYVAVDRQFTTIASGNGNIYINPDTPKKIPAAPGIGAKSNNITGTNGNAANRSIVTLTNGRLWQNLMGNNGRMEVPFTDLSLTKSWDVSLNRDTNLIKTEYVQLYSELRGLKTSVGVPLELEPDHPNAQPPGDPWPSAQASWERLPVYGLTADGGGNTELIQYTVTEGSYLANQFTAYPDQTDQLTISYSQPLWDVAAEQLGDAQIINYSRYDKEWFIVLNKIFEGIDPNEKFTQAGKSIELVPYVSDDGGQHYYPLDVHVWDDTKMAIEYPADFTSDQMVISMLAAEDQIRSDKMSFLLVEKDHDVAGYRWSVTAAGTGVTPVTNAGTRIIYAYDTNGQFVVDANAIGPEDYAFEIKDIPNKGIAGFDLTNQYELIAPLRFTLEKNYVGAVNAADDPDITFIVEGYADRAAFEEAYGTGDFSERIFYDTTSSGMLNYVKDINGKLTFPIDPLTEAAYANDVSAPAGYQPIAHPQVLPPGYYVITEEYDGGVEKNGRVYDVSDISATLTNNGGTLPLPAPEPVAVTTKPRTADSYPAVGFVLETGKDFTVSLANTYQPRPRLVLQKAFAGDVPDPVPAGIADNITFIVLNDEGNIVRNIFYNQFVNGEYIINDLPPGKYTVQEVADEEVASYELVSTVAQPSGVITLTAGALDQMVKFTNTYQTSDSLTIRKALTGNWADWKVDGDTKFTVVVKDVTDPTKPVYLIFDGNNKLIGTSVIMLGGTQLAVSQNKPVTVSGLPMGNQYQVMEIKPVGEVYEPSYSGYDPNEDYITTTAADNVVTVSNQYPVGMGNLIITKALLGHPADWGVTGAEEFQIRIYDQTAKQYLTFVKSTTAISRAAGGRYQVVGDENGLYPGISLSPSEVILSRLPLSADAPLTIENIKDTTGQRYVVREVQGNVGTDHYTYGGDQPVPAVASNSNAFVTITNEYESAQGNLSLAKRLAGSPADWGVDENTLFQARLRVISSTEAGVDAGKYLVFDNTNAFTGANATGSIIEFSESKVAMLTNIPVGSYAVEEVSTGTYNTVSYATYAGNQKENDTGIVSIVADANKTVEVTNTYIHDVGNMVVRKTLAGAPEDWGVNRDTVFTFQVEEEDTSDPNIKDLLYFVQTGPNTYWCIGKSGAFEPGYDAADGVTDIPFTANNPTILKNLWVGREYYVTERGGSNYHMEYLNGGQYLSPNDSVSLPTDGAAAVGNLDVEVINTFDRGTDALIVAKQLAGSFTDWGKNNDSVFQAKVYEHTVSGRKQLLFEEKPTGKGNYECISNGGDTGAPDLDVIDFSPGQPAILTGLPPGRYEIEEFKNGDTDPYQVTYAGYDNNTEPIVTLPVDATRTVTVTNTYDPGTTALEIRKVLDADAAAWGITEDTVFYAMIKCLDDAGGPNYVKFPTGRTAYNTYYAKGNNGSATRPLETETEYMISFTVKQPVTITGLWPNRHYVIEEIFLSNATDIAAESTIYKDADTGQLIDANVGIMLVEDTPVTVAVTNDYPATSGSMTVTKELAGDSSAWGADADKLFRANVVDITNPSQEVIQVFERQEAGKYHRLSNSGAVAQGTEIIQFSENQAAELTGLLPKHIYEIRELLGGSYYSTTFDYDGQGDTPPELVAEIPVAVTVTNTYLAGTTSLKVEKEITGAAGAWNVSDFTEFRATVAKMNGTNVEKYIKFSGKTTDNIYSVDVAGSSTTKPQENDGDYEDYLITFSVSQAALLVGLEPGDYAVTELNSGEFTPIYRYGSGTGSITVATNTQGTVEVINSYHSPTTTTLTILKDLTGDYAAAWNGNDTFRIQVKDTDSGELVKFVADANAADSYYADQSGTARMFVASETPTPLMTGAMMETPTPSGNPESTVAPTPTATPESGATPTPTGAPESSVTPAPSGTPESNVTPTPSGAPVPTATPKVESSPMPTVGGEENKTPAPTAGGEEDEMPAPTAGGEGSKVPMPIADSERAETSAPMASGEESKNPAPTAGEAGSKTSIASGEENKTSASTDKPKGNGTSASTDTVKADATSALTGAPVPTKIPIITPTSASIKGSKLTNMPVPATVPMSAQASRLTAASGLFSMPLSVHGDALGLDDMVRLQKMERFGVSADARTTVAVNAVDTPNADKASNTEDTSALSGAPNQDNTSDLSGKPSQDNTSASSSKPSPDNTSASSGKPSPDNTSAPSGKPNPDNTSAPSGKPNPDSTPNPSGMPNPDVSPNPDEMPNPSGTQNPDSTPDPDSTPNPSGTSDPDSTPNPDGTPVPTATPEVADLLLMSQEMELLAGNADAKDYIDLYPGEPVTIFGLLPNKTYEVVEEDSGGAEVQYLYIENSGARLASPSVLREGGAVTVVISNKYKSPEASLTIRKELTGDAGSWNLSANQKFDVQITDVTNANSPVLLTFDAAGKLTTGSGSDILQVGVNSPVTVSGLTVNRKYQVEELKPSGAIYSDTYEGNDSNSTYITLQVSGTNTVTVKNDYPTRPSSPPDPSNPSNPPGSSTTVSNPPPAVDGDKETPSPSPLPDWELPTEENPPTGDRANVSLWWLLLTGAILAAAGLAFVGRKNPR